MLRFVRRWCLPMFWKIKKDENLFEKQKLSWNFRESFFKFVFSNTKKTTNEWTFQTAGFRDYQDDSKRKSYQLRSDCKSSRLSETRKTRRECASQLWWRFSGAQSLQFFRNYYCELFAVFHTKTEKRRRGSERNENPEFQKYFLESSGRIIIKNNDE